MGLVESAASGDRLQALRDLRDTIAGTIAASDSGRDVAALSARFTDVLAQIAALDTSEKIGDPLDEITARRVARGGSTARSGRA